MSINMFQSKKLSSEFHKSSKFIFSLESSSGQNFCNFTNQDWTTNFLLQHQPKCKYRNHIDSCMNISAVVFVVGVTCWLVFHMRIIYIGKGCIYSPFLIKHPQPLRSYLDNVSQYTGLKPSTETNRMHTFPLLIRRSLARMKSS